VTLRLVAEYGDACNIGWTLADFTRKNKVLDEWCDKVGRDRKAVERTTPVWAADIDELPRYVEAGAEHVIVSLGPPYDMESVEKALQLAEK
jgi:hypothetical protein